MQQPVKTGSPTELAAQFRALADQWAAETGLFSFDYQRSRHPAYRQILALGQPVIPLLLQELQERPDHWFGALTTLAGENPIPPAAAGKFDQMVAAWLDWGRRQGYISLPPTLPPPPAQ